MSAQILNRVAALLAWGGAFVAGVLSYAHHTASIPPCGAGSEGCAKVAADASSYWFGIPVADFGVGGYLLLALLALAREFAVGPRWALLTKAGTYVSGAGFALSMMLVYTSLAVLQATCYWCIASAAVMTALFLVHIALSTRKAPEARPAGLTGYMTSVVGAILAIGLVGATVPSLKGMAVEIDLGDFAAEDIVPPANRLIGPGDAPIKIVEFADVNCAACRSSFLDVKVIVTSGKGKIQMGYRHFPLYTKEGHETSLQAAVVAQYAAKLGKFWAFLEVAMDQRNTERIKDLEGLLALASEAGLDEGGVAKALDPDSPETAEVIRDFEIVQTLGLQLTPSFLVLAPGAPPRVATPNQLAVLLTQSPYDEIIRGR